MSENVREFLRSIHASGALEVCDSEELDIRTARLVQHALDGRFIRDDSSGWDFGARYILTEEGLRLLEIEQEKLSFDWPAWVMRGIYWVANTGRRFL